MTNMYRFESIYRIKKGKHILRDGNCNGELDLGWSWDFYKKSSSLKGKCRDIVMK